MEEVGVTAVVEGLSSFLGDINKMNGALSSLMPQGNALTGLFGGIGDVIANFGREVLNVAEYALGKILADAIEFVVTKFKELVSATIEAGAEFQTLQLRLTRLNFNDAIKSGLSFSAAMEQATKSTKEQLQWVQLLAVQSPYDAQDIANVFTLAKSYGFASSAAEKLTSDIVDFSSGMGLSNQALERIVVNFGQMSQQGKVNQRDLNDLARGAFVPVNDLLKQMSDDVGLTGQAFTDFSHTQAGVTALMQAFSEVVKNRFQGAAATMARTFEGATNNAQDFVKSLIGFNVVTPILDKVGGKIADVVGALTSEENWDNLTKAAQRVGAAISTTLDQVFGLIPSADGVAKGIAHALNVLGLWISKEGPHLVEFFKGIGNAIQTQVIPFITGVLLPGLQRISDWFVQHRESIVGFFKDMGLAVKNDVAKFVLGVLLPAFYRISEWVYNNKPLIITFFESLGKIVSGVFEKLSGTKLDGSGLQAFLQGITTFMTYVINNQDTITNLIVGLTQLWAIFTAVGFVIGIITGILGTIVAAFISVITVVAGVIAIIATLFTPIGLLIALFVLLGAMVVANWNYIVVAFQYLGVVITTWAATTLATIVNWWTQLWSNFSIGVAYTQQIVSQWWTELWSNFNIGITYTVQAVAQWWTDMSTTIQNGAKMILSNIAAFVKDIKSQIQEQDWYLVGERIIQGIEKGVRQAAQSLINSVVAAAKAAIAAVNGALGINSPSKVFAEIGAMTMEGFAQGVVGATNMVAKTMEQATATIVAPALNLPGITQQVGVQTGASVNNSNSYTNNFNLTVNSASSKEPIIQDYNMMRSIVQA